MRGEIIDAVLQACTEHLEQGGGRTDLQLRIETYLAMCADGTKINFHDLQHSHVSMQTFTDTAAALREEAGK